MLRNAVRLCIQSYGDAPRTDAIPVSIIVPYLLYGYACFFRCVRIDQKRFGKIPGVTDREYYTNSFHVPVYYPIGAFQKIKIEAPYHALTNAGHISYVELDGDTAKNPEAFEAIIRCMKESGIGYGSVNHPVDRDPVCGFTGVIDDVCPRCGRHEGEAVSIERLNELRKKYPDIPVYFDPNH